MFALNNLQRLYAIKNERNQTKESKYISYKCMHNWYWFSPISLYYLTDFPPSQNVALGYFTAESWMWIENPDQKPLGPLVIPHIGAPSYELNWALQVLSGEKTFWDQMIFTVPTTKVNLTQGHFTVGIAHKSRLIQNSYRVCSIDIDGYLSSFPPVRIWQCHFYVGTTHESRRIRSRWKNRLFDIPLLAEARIACWWYSCLEPGNSD